MTRRTRPWTLAAALMLLVSPAAVRGGEWRPDGSEQTAQQRPPRGEAEPDAKKEGRARDGDKKPDTAVPRDGDKQADKAVPRDERDRGDRRDRRDGPQVRAQLPRPGRVVFVGGYFYDPWIVGNPWWPPVHYPYYRIPAFDTRAQVRVMASPRHAAVYVDGFYAGIVDDFDGIFQPLPLLPGGHTIALFLDGYRTVNKSVYLVPGSTFKLRVQLEPMPPGVASAPPALSPVFPEPPQGTYIPLRTPPRNQPEPPASVAAAPSAGFGILSLRVHPATATITIDGHEWLSSTPGELVVHLAVGRHTVTVASTGHTPFTRDVEIRLGETLELNVSVPAVHTH